MEHEPDENSVPRYSDELDSLDASVFTGEMLWCNINEFEAYLKRWQKEVDEHKIFMKREEEEDK